jgi:prepilin-type processing-associated H-X9-DG protein
MNGDPAWGNNITPPPAPQQVNFQKLTEITMSPALALVFVEESPATINDGYWIQNLDQPTDWIDSPGHFHNNGCSMSFADGHSEMRVWTDRQILANAVNPNNEAWNGFAEDPAHPQDLAWVHQRVTIVP